MSSLRERRLVGLEYLEAVTTLLQRIRNAHPTAGLWEAADRQWSWRNPRATDGLPQLFWFDDLGPGADDPGPAQTSAPDVLAIRVGRPSFAGDRTVMTLGTAGPQFCDLPCTG